MKTNTIVEVQLKNTKMVGKFISREGQNAFIMVGNEVFKFHHEQLKEVVVIQTCPVEDALSAVVKSLPEAQFDGYHHNDLHAEGISSEVHLLVEEDEDGNLIFDLWVNCKRKRASNESLIKKGELSECETDADVSRYHTTRKTVSGAVNFFKRHLHI